MQTQSAPTQALTHPKPTAIGAPLEQTRLQYSSGNFTPNITVRAQGKRAQTKTWGAQPRHYRCFLRTPSAYMHPTIARVRYPWLMGTDPVRPPWEGAKPINYTNTHATTRASEKYA